MDFPCWNLQDVIILSKWRKRMYNFLTHIYYCFLYFSWKNNKYFFGVCFMNSNRGISIIGRRYANITLTPSWNLIFFLFSISKKKGCFELHLGTKSKSIQNQNPTPFLIYNHRLENDFMNKFESTLCSTLQSEAVVYLDESCYDPAIFLLVALLFARFLYAIRNEVLR